MDNNSLTSTSEQFIPTPEFLTHTLTSNFLNKEVAKNYLCLPETLQKYFKWKNNNEQEDYYIELLLPLVNEAGSLKDLDKMVQYASFQPYNQSEEILHSKLSDKFKDSIGFIKESELGKLYEFIFELLIFSQIKNFPILMAKSSPSKIKSLLDRINDLFHLFHKPALLKLFDGDKEFGEKIKIYGEQKLKSLGLLFTKEGRGALIWTGTFFLIGKCLLNVYTTAIEIGWFVFYDP